VTIIHPGNVKFGLKDLNFIVGWAVYHVESNLKIFRISPQYQGGCWFIQGVLSEPALSLIPWYDSQN
jgi:hypothetical protein